MSQISTLNDLTEATKKYLKKLQNLGWSAEEIANHTGLSVDAVKKALSD